VASEHMRLDALVEISEQISATTRKKQKVSLIAGMLLQARGEEIALAAHYLSGQIRQGRIGVASKILRGALQDLSPSPPPLHLIDVDRFFEVIARESGPGSTKRKVQALCELLSRCNQRERAFLIRLIMGELRQGATEGLMLEAVGQASSLSHQRLRQALMFSGDIGEVAQVALEEGPSGLARFGPSLFHPISPMLASPAEGAEEAIARLGEAGWEYKIDGARVQIHKQGDDVQIFTRHLKQVTESVPEIVHLTRKFRVEEAIFEGEIIALRGDGKPQPFQTTMRRFGRVKDVAKLQKLIPLTPYFFDLLLLDGEPLFELPYQKRIERLARNIPSEHMVPRIITADAKKARDFLLSSLEAGHEGVMAKALHSPYVAGQRGFNWLKIKPAKSLDLVILAAEWGHGRRRGYLSNLHLGARDPEGGRFVMLGKTFKGLTDEMLHWQTRRLLELEISRDQWTVYVKPELVVEVAFGDLQQSLHYPAGLALRFARVKQFRRDKSAHEADTIQEVRRIFETSRA
jgi:DNA ligase-1